MISKKLEKIWLLKCPKDLFGELEPCTKETLNALLASEPEIKGEPGDYTTGLFNLYKSWAYEAIKNGTYDQCLPYCTKLTFEIEKTPEGAQRFLFTFPDHHSVSFRSLPAYYFEGYLQNDSFRIERNGEEIDSGVIKYYGTHGAVELFFRNNDKKEIELSAKEFEPGDILTIETVRWLNPKEFGKFLLKMGVQ